MASAFQEQMENSDFQNLAFEEHVGLMADKEWTSRNGNHMNRLKKGAPVYMSKILNMLATSYKQILVYKNYFRVVILQQSLTIRKELTLWLNEIPEKFRKKAFLNLSFKSSIRSKITLKRRILLLTSLINRKLLSMAKTWIASAFFMVL